MKNQKTNALTEVLKPYIGLILLVILFAIFTGGQSLTPKNIRTVTEQSFSLMLATIGVFFVMTTGLMDLSISGVACICCFVLAKAGAVSIPLGLALTLATGLLLGLFNGVVTSVLKVPSFLATLCTAYICTGIMTHLSASTSATIPFALYDLNTFGFKFPFTLVLALFAYTVYHFRPFGHYVRMIGSNELAAHFSAVKVTKVKILCYVIDGGFAACAAFLIGIKSGTAAITTGSDLMFNTMVALTLGGFAFGGDPKARISAAIVGSITVYVLNNGMLLMGMTATTMQFVKGCLFLVVILLTSSGYLNRYQIRKTGRGVRKNAGKAA